jgi:hypothetical protein
MSFLHPWNSANSPKHPLTEAKDPVWGDRAAARRLRELT